MYVRGLHRLKKSGRRGHRYDEAGVARARERILRYRLPDRLLNDPDFLFCQPVQLVDELVNLPIRRLDLPLNGRLVHRCLGRVEP